MKKLVSAIVLSLAVAGTALAQMPSGSRSFSQPLAEDRIAANIEPQLPCDIRLQHPGLVAMVNPTSGESWTLSVQAPGLYSDQSGTLHGGRDYQQRVSSFMAMGDSYGDPRNRMLFGVANLPRPLHAELKVYDVDGLLVCRDVVDLP